MKTEPTAGERELPNGPDAWSNQQVIFCNHEGYFTADVIVTPLAVVVIAKREVNPSKLTRSNLDRAEWRITDAHGGYWNPIKGRFVVPRQAVTRLTLQGK